MTRIVAGEAKGRVLKVPARGTRPTSERVREALFSRLDAMNMCDGVAVLDLYAGSGALAFEALSRGAARADMVDSSRQAARAMSRNAAKMGYEDRTRIHTLDALAFVQSDRVSSPVDLVFVDPPYDLAQNALAAVLAGLAAHLSPDALVIVERSTRSQAPDLPDGLVCEDHRHWGETAAWFIGRADRVES